MKQNEIMKGLEEAKKTYYFYDDEGRYITYRDYVPEGWTNFTEKEPLQMDEYTMNYWDSEKEEWELCEWNG